MKRWTMTLLIGLCGGLLVGLALGAFVPANRYQVTAFPTFAGPPYK